MTLHIQARFFEAFPASLFDGERVPITISINGLIDFLVRNLPQEAQKPCRQQLVVFLERVCEAGDQADPMREYLGDLVTTRHTLEGSYLSETFPQALSALAGKDLLTTIQTHVRRTRKWTRLAVAELDLPYITQLIVATLLTSQKVGVQRLHSYFLSLLKK